MKNFKLINHIQTEIVVIDKDMTVIDANNAFQDRRDQSCPNAIGSKCFNAAYNFTEGCGYKKSSSCPVRKSFLTKKPSSAIHHFWIEDHAVVEELTTTPIVEDNGKVNYVVEEYRDLSHLLALKDGIIGICSYCRKIHDNDGQWVTFEAYLHKHTGANFSHGICEECHEQLFSEFDPKGLCSH